MTPGARHYQGAGDGGSPLPSKPVTLERKTGIIPFFSWRNALECLLGGICVFTLCMIGQEFYKVAGTFAAPLWPSSGLALALLLLRGWRLFPAIILGTIAATQTFGDSLLFSVAGSAGNTLESLTGWYLLTRVFNFSNYLQYPRRDMLLLFLAGTPFGTFLSALICTLSLAHSGVVMTSGPFLSTVLFWSGNMLGIIAFTPLIVILGEQIPFFTDKKTRRGGILFLLIPFSSVLFVFGNKFLSNHTLDILSFLLFPIFIWTALFLGLPSSALSVAVVATIGTGLTLFGLGPFVSSDPNETCGQLTLYLLILGTSSLVMAAIEQERTHGKLKKRLSTLTAGLGYWEWSQNEGVRNLAMIDNASAATAAEMGFPIVLPNDWISTVASEEAIHFPWNQIRPGFAPGDFISGDVTLKVDSSTLTIVVTGRVLQIDREGCPVSIIGTAREVTSERLSAKLRIVAARQELELRNIRSHLNPHFLFNSLNVIKALIIEDATKAQSAIVSLSQLLRISLQATQGKLIPLSTEISLIRSLIDLQKMRYEDRLQAVMSIEAETESVMIPPMIFQQLVENAIKHGIDSRIYGGEIRVEALLERSHLLLAVNNPGTLREGSHNSFGLRSIHEQLDSIYGTRASFRVVNQAGDAVRAEIRIPLMMN